MGGFFFLEEADMQKPAGSVPRKGPPMKVGSHKRQIAKTKMIKYAVSRTTTPQVERPKEDVGGARPPRPDRGIGMRRIFPVSGPGKAPPRAGSPPKPRPRGVVAGPMPPELSTFFPQKGKPKPRYKVGDRIPGIQNTGTAPPRTGSTPPWIGHGDFSGPGGSDVSKMDKLPRFAKGGTVKKGKAKKR